MSVDEELEAGRHRHSMTGFAVVLIIMAVVLIGLIAFGRLRGHGLEYPISFRDAKGLRAGDPVMLSGVQIGEVRKVDLLGESQVVVTVRIRGEHAAKVRQGSTAVIASNTFPNVSGQMIVDIHNPVDETAPPLVAGTQVEGRRNVVDLKAWQIQQTLGKLGDKVSEESRTMAQKIGTMVEELKDIPESPEVKDAIEKLQEMSQDLTTRGKEKWQDVSKKWDELSRDYAPLIEQWKARSKEKASQAYEKGREAVKNATQRARQYYEQSGAASKPAEQTP